jgi:hypothetical protein
MPNESSESSVANRRGSERVTPRQGFLRQRCRRGVTGLGSDMAMTLLDISETGARLVVTHALPKNQEVEVEFEAQGILHIIKRIGNVRWQLLLADGQFCTGVQFQKRLGYMEWQRIMKGLEAAS